MITLISCSSNIPTSNKILPTKVILPDWKEIFFKSINNYLDEANIPKIEKLNLSDKDLHIRIWIGFGMVHLRMIDIQRINNKWAGLFYKKILDDSTKKLKIEPQSISPLNEWNNLIKKLTQNNFFELPDMSELADDKIYILDGTSYVVEIGKTDFYRTYHFENPSHHKWKESEQFLEILKILESEFKDIKIR